jgi:hypothetical protein
MTTADTVTTQRVAAIGAGVTANKPPFLGMVQAELGKIIRWRAIWFTLLGIGLLMLLLNGLTYFFTLYSLTNAQGLGERNQPLPLPPAEAIPYVMMTTLLDAVRQYSGLVIAILAVMLIAAEFQFGTIRIVLGRGVGRIRLLLSKMSALLVIAGVFAPGFHSRAELRRAGDPYAQRRARAMRSSAIRLFWSDAGLYLHR